MLDLRIDTRGFDYPDVPIPHVRTIRQHMEAPALPDIEAATRAAAETLVRDPRLRPGATVAVGVGSRGVANIQVIVRALVGVLRDRGCEPFIVPAMGSHGGATADGQQGILAGYGVTEAGVGAPVRATMEVEKVAALDDGYPVYFDCNALSADAVIVVNRVKPHTDFSGDIESGLCKMCAIGLGKQKGAASIHRFGAQGLREIMPAIGRKLTETVPIVGGIAAIENPFGQTAELHGLRGDEIGRARERQLLERARELMPRLPFRELDVLVVDQMGKNISGAGMDTNVLGRLRMPSIPESEWHGPNVRIVCCLDLTDETHGNASGLGLADYVTRRLIERVDFEITNLNSRTSGEGGAFRTGIPIVLEDAEACVRAAVATCGRGHPEQVRLARIRDTEHVQVLEASEAALATLGERADTEVLSGPHAADLERPLTLG